MISNLIIYFAVNLIVVFLIYIGIYYILVSDFLSNLTGYTLFYKNEHRRKMPVDYVRIFFYNIITPLLIVVENIWFVNIFLRSDVLFYGGLIYGLINIYFAILLFVRVKYFFYKDEYRDMRERDVFKNYKDNHIDIRSLTHESEKYDDGYVIEYIGFGSWNVMISIVLLLYAGLYLMTGLFELIYIIILLIVYMHLMLIPDYLNKIWPYDIRTQRGRNICYKALLVIFMIGGYGIYIALQAGIL